MLQTRYCIPTNLLARFNLAPNITILEWHQIYLLISSQNNGCEVIFLSEPIENSCFYWLYRRKLPLCSLQTLSQIGHIFTYNGMAILWLSTKQTFTVTYSNHLEILALHEASRECVWLQSIMHYIQITSNLASVIEIPTIIYENNIACLAQIRGGYNKRDRTKYISPKLFCTHEVQQDKKIMSSNYAPLILLLIFLLNLCSHQHLRSQSKILACIDLTNYQIYI